MKRPSSYSSISPLPPNTRDEYEHKAKQEGRASPVSPHAHLAHARRMKVLVKPRLQKDKWSLYWKTSMATRTQALDTLQMDVDPASTTGKELRAAVAAAVGLPPERDLCRLEGFKEPWELMCVRNAPPSRHGHTSPPSS